MTLVLGLTGSFGTGKTFVASIFKSLGAKVIDADKLAHSAIKKSSPVYRKIVAAFGRDILDKAGNIERRKLAAIVFNDRKKLKRLNRLVHPEVIREIKGEIKRSKGYRAVVVDAPLLMEANLEGLVDKLIVVKASRKNQVARCTNKFSITKGECMKRIRCQIPLAKKIKAADFIIDNDWTKAGTLKQAGQIWR